MKKIFFGLAALMLSMTVLAERVSQEDAALVANNFMNVGNTVSGVQKAPAKKMVLKKAATASENQYYVYENANGEGWVMVAANDVVSPILAYSNTGTFRTDNQPVNVRTWLGKYDKFITKIEADGAAQDEEVAAEWSALKKGVRKAKGDAIVGPLIKTTWDQDDPYWTLTPNGSGSIDKAYTGCVATAMAQVMNYWQWPKQGKGSHTYQPIMQLDDDGDGYPDRDTIIYPGNLTANFGETTYDWDNMLNKYTNSATTAQENAVATLMFHCGVSVEMMYGDDNYGGSGAYTGNYGDWTDPTCAQNAFPTYFGYKKDGLVSYMRDGFSSKGTEYYKKWSDPEWTAMVKEELDKKHPIMYGGAGDEGGHSFICDGYDDSNYFHFNWGWSGQNDGYYKLSSLKPGSGGAGGGGYDFSEDQDVIIGIVPDKKDMPKVIVTWSVDGEETDVEFTQEDPLVLPDNPANCENGKVFVGWTAQSEVSGERPSDLFTKAGSKSVIEAITYYAVFANEEGEGSKDITLDATKDTSFPKDGITLTTSNGALDNGTDYRIYKGATLTITSSVGDMSSIAFTFSGSYDGGGWESTYTPNAATWTSPACTSGSSGKQARITKIVVTVGGATYSNYSLTCSGVTPEPVYYNIRFFNNGTQIGETQNVLKNQQAEVPTGITAECEDYTFVGWWTAELPANNQVAQTWVTNFKATKDQDYYAIFSKTEAGQGGEAAFDGTTGGDFKFYGQKGETKYYAKASVNSSNKLESTTDETEAATFTFAKVDGGFTIKNGDKYLAYAGSSTNVKLQADAYTWDISASDAGAGSWRAVASTATTRALVLRVTDSYQSFGAYATSNITGTEYFDLEIGGGAPAATTYYSSVVTCGETAIDNNVVAPKAIKVLENGQIVIILGDQKYTIFGQKIQ